MAYTRTTWVDDETPLDATNMNNIEQGIVDNESQINQVAGSKVDDTTYQQDKSDITERLSTAESDIDALEAKTAEVGSNITVEPTDWGSDGTFTDYPYAASITIAGLTSDTYTQVLFDSASLDLDILAPFCSTSTDTLTVYAREIPEDDVTILSVVKLF